MGQSTPEALYPETLKDGSPFSTEELEAATEVRGHAIDSIEAAQELYRARLGILKASLEFPADDMEEEDYAENLASCEAWLVEGFRRDLEALSFHLSWLPAGCVEPSTRPGRQELLFRPVLESILFSQVDGSTSEICAGYSHVNSLWMERQDAFMEHLHSLYGNGEPTPDASGRLIPFTRMSWPCDDEGQLTPEARVFRSNMQALIRKEQNAWKRYHKVMLDLVCPGPGYRGSGVGMFMSAYEPHLLDSRERFLCLLAAGDRGLRHMEAVDRLRLAELQELHSKHPFGEIFTEAATLFRHPKLEGNPWCIRFHDCGAGFIFVNDSATLRRYAAENPGGSEQVEVQGYQCIEHRATPWLPEDGESTATGAPGPQQVFHLLSYSLPDDEGEGEDSGETE